MHSRGATPQPRIILITVRTPLQRLLVALGLLLTGSVTSAQTIDPRYAEFTASADHSALTSTGQPMVTRYDLEFYYAGATGPFQTNPLGKPTPDANNLIRVDLNTILVAYPPPGAVYEARVSAVGPTGTARSDLSNQFAFTNPCAPALSPTATSLPATSSTGTVSVAVATGCAWTATSNVSWVTITAGASGSGNGTVSYSVGANTSTSSRTGTLTIAGQTFSIGQAAACDFAISPSSVAVSSVAGSGTVAVTAGAGCAWTAVSSASWITITSGASGSGNGSVGYSLAANTSPASRTGTVVIAGRTFTVTQAGVPCTSSITPTSVSVQAGATTGTIVVSIAAGCSWTATSGASWLTIISGASGNGSSTVSYSAAANSAVTSRTATITVAGQVFTVTQAGVVCSTSISPTASSPTAAGGTGTVAVTSNAAGCAWTAVSNASWIVVTSGASGSGSASITYSAAPNSSGLSRTGTITIAAQTFTVTQAGVACSYAVSPTDATVTSDASTGTISVTSPSGCSWVASSSAAWVTITTSASGAGNGTVTYSVAANPTTSSRSATLTIAGRTFTLVQAGIPCGYMLSPPGASVPATASNQSMSVTALAGCAWTAASGASWISITAGASGTGNGSVSYSVAPNGTTSPRTGTLTIAGQAFTVTQSGGSCSYTASPESQSFAAAGGTGTVTLTTLGGCAWSAQTSASWITITAGASGSGNGTIAYQVAANPAATTRSATIAVGGQVVTITQAAAPCSYSLSPSSVSLGAEGGAGSLSVTAGSGCVWTASSSASWLTVTSATTGSGSGTIEFSAAPNPTTTGRTANLTVAGQSFTVTQAGQACSYTLSTTTLPVSAPASTTTVNVTALPGCAWTAVSSAPWITIANGASGSGTGAVTLSIQTNSAGTSRTGIVTIAGEAVIVTQQGVACTTSITPSTVAVAAIAANGSVAVTTPAGCAWSASSGASWITITSGASGTGPGSVSYSVAAHTGAIARSGVLTIGGQTFTVTQAGQPCAFSISPSGVSVGQAGGTDTVAVTATSGCAWTAATSTPWITITSGATGSGSGTVTVTVAANTGTSSRSGTMTIAGHVFTITQAGTCTYTLSPLSISVGTGATNANVYVFTSTGCAWSAVSATSWITVTAGATGTGSGLATLRIEPNSGSASRTGTATIANQEFSVNQAGCTFSVSPASVSAAASGRTSNAFVMTDAACTWSASSAASWIAFPKGASGTGTAWLAYSIEANTATASRNGVMTIAGRSIPVEQAAAPCTYAVSPSKPVVANTGGTTTLTVTTASGCSWTATSGASWITIESVSTTTGDGLVVLQVAPNPTPFARAAFVSIAGKSILVTQQVITLPPPPANLRIIR